MESKNVRRTALGTNVNDNLKKQFKITLIKRGEKLAEVLERFMKDYIQESVDDTIKENSNENT